MAQRLEFEHRSGIWFRLSRLFPPSSGEKGQRSGSLLRVHHLLTELQVCALFVPTAYLGCLCHRVAFEGSKKWYQNGFVASIGVGRACFILLQEQGVFWAHTNKDGKMPLKFLTNQFGGWGRTKPVYPQDLPPAEQVRLRMGREGP